MATSTMPRARFRIKRTPADAAFSDYIRARAGYCCERCGLQFVKGKTQYLHCSHNYQRGHTNIRYHPLNAFALCKNCHYWFERCRIESTPWMQKKLGEENYNRLLHDMATLAEPSEADEKQIAAYYRVLTGLLNPTISLPPKPDTDKTEARMEAKKAKNRKINDLDLMERMLQSYSKVPEHCKKSYHRQITDIMVKYPCR